MNKRVLTLFVALSITSIRCEAQSFLCPCHYENNLLELSVPEGKRSLFMTVLPDVKKRTQTIMYYSVEDYSAYVSVYNFDFSEQIGLYSSQVLPREIRICMEDLFMAAVMASSYLSYDKIDAQKDIVVEYREFAARIPGKRTNGNCKEMQSIICKIIKGVIRNDIPFLESVIPSMRQLTEEFYDRNGLDIRFYPDRYLL